MSGKSFKILGVAYVFVVLGPGHPGAGRIKKIPLVRNINSTLIEWEGDVVRISKQEENSGCGSRFLDELYAEQGTPERFTVYCKWVEAGTQGRTLDVQEFPQDLLPTQVVEWRKHRAKAAAQFDPRAMLASMGDAPAPAIELAAEPEPAPVPAPVAPGRRPARTAPHIPVTIDLPTEVSGGE